MMIYTIGRIDIYEPYIDNDPNPGKGKGGSVWEMYENAANRIKDNINYRVYGVDADWELDTEKVDGEIYRALKYPCSLVKI